MPFKTAWKFSKVPSAFSFFGPKLMDLLCFLLISSSTIWRKSATFFYLSSLRKKFNELSNLHRIWSLDLKNWPDIVSPVDNVLRNLPSSEESHQPAELRPVLHHDSAPHLPSPHSPSGRSRAPSPSWPSPPTWRRTEWPPPTSPGTSPSPWGPAWWRRGAGRSSSWPGQWWRTVSPGSQPW